MRPFEEIEPSFHKSTSELKKHDSMQLVNTDVFKNINYTFTHRIYLLKIVITVYINHYYFFLN